MYGLFRIFFYLIGYLSFFFVLFKYWVRKEKWVRVGERRDREEIIVEFL